MRRGRIAVLASAALILACALTAGVSSAASGKHARYRIVSLCGVPHPGSAACMAEKRVPSSLTSAQLKASAKRQRQNLRSGVRTAVTNSELEPGYLTPQSLHAAYSLPSESSSSGAQTISFGKLTASFKVISPTQIEATVPNGATAGKVSLTTHYGSATSKAKFTPRSP